MTKNPNISNLTIRSPRQQPPFNGHRLKIGENTTMRRGCRTASLSRSVKWRMCPASGGRAQAQCPEPPGKMDNIGKKCAPRRQRQGSSKAPEEDSKAGLTPSRGSAHTYWQESEAEWAPGRGQEPPREAAQHKGSVRKGTRETRRTSQPQSSTRRLDC